MNTPDAKLPELPEPDGGDYRVASEPCLIKTIHGDYYTARYVAYVDPEYPPVWELLGRDGLQLDEADIAEWRYAREAIRTAAGWRPMDSAPKGGKEILVYREDAGVFMASWYAAQDRMTDRDIERECRNAEARGEPIDWLEQEDWFSAEGERLEGDEVPTHWQPLPAPPSAPDAREDSNEN